MVPIFDKKFIWILLPPFLDYNALFLRMLMSFGDFHFSFPRTATIFSRSCCNMYVKASSDFWLLADLKGQTNVTTLNFWRHTQNMYRSLPPRIDPSRNRPMMNFIVLRIYCFVRSYQNLCKIIICDNTQICHD